MKKSQQSVLVLVLSIALFGCSDGEYQAMSGQTMGTYYALKYQTSAVCQPQQGDVDELLDRVNVSMSTYRDDSELSRINASQATDWVSVSASLGKVLSAASTVYEQSSGAFDVTVGPLVNLWGFGPANAGAEPDAAAQSAAAARVGMHKLQVERDRLRKAQPDLYIDLSALAKGFGVDELVRYLGDSGCTDFMVDIGGEIRTAGINDKGVAWRVGIESPRPEQLGGLHRVLQVQGMAVATSGDYRNYRVVDGRRVDHVLDPRTGTPADNHVVSATVMHASAMWADAYATALMVLGWQAGQQFAREYRLPVFLIRRTPTGEERFESFYNEAMAQYLLAP